MTSTCIPKFIMCGIVGRVNFKPEIKVDYWNIRRMADSLRHRGPDDEGVWIKGSVGLGHRRLAIIDLSPSGRNPMCNEDGTVWIVFNGEIYNFLELRRELEQKGHQFRSRTDTEVILHLYEEMGTNCVKRLTGMFAFAIWDDRQRQMMLARDRLGKKPLYYELQESHLIFGSELKAVLRSGEATSTPDFDSIHQFLLWQCIPSPNTVFTGIKKLPPASILVWQERKGVRIENYWTLNYGDQSRASEAEIAANIRELTFDATKVRLVADVPVGLFLSGGIDSACVLAAARKTHTGPIQTFSVAFGEQEFDESKYARILARHFSTDHHEFRASSNIIDLLTRMTELFDEPFADPSAIPTYYLAKLTREHVKVALSGDGGDEAFGGYQRYFAMKFLRLAGRLPGASYLAKLRALLPYGTARRSATRYIKEMLSLVGCPAEQQYKALFLGMMRENQWKELYTPEFRSALNSYSEDFIQWNGHGEPDELACAMASDTLRYIPECLNVKLDRASMACSLEVRSPFLDHKLVEFSASIPSSMKIQWRTQKFILKRAFQRELPPEILQRGKSGFTVPLSRWFRNELSGLAQDSLLSGNSAIRDVILPGRIDKMLQDHRSRKHNWHIQLWRLLVLENWLQATKACLSATSR